FFVFFFSSRRRHTRSDRDWSSDVCSSDLTTPCDSPSVCSGFSKIYPAVTRQVAANGQVTMRITIRIVSRPIDNFPTIIGGTERRSEERRVGKECRCRRRRDE